MAPSEPPAFGNLLNEHRPAEFGPLLRHYRIAAGLTQEELAERAGISARAVSDMERGLRKRPYRDTVDRLAIPLRLSREQREELTRLARPTGHHSVSSGASVQLDDGDEYDTGAWSPAQVLPSGGFLGALPSIPLVGRHRELERLLATVDAVRNGSGRLVMLVGEPGAGKTRLAQEATVRLREEGFLVAVGRSYQPEEQSPYYPFLDVLAAIHAAIPNRIRVRVPAEWPYLSVLLPDLLGPAPAGNERETEGLVLRAVTAFVRTIAEMAPVAILLDDLHWADASSIKLLLHLARHTRSSRILLLGTYRDVEVGRHHPLEDAVGDLTREDLMERIAVRRLDPDDTRRLIAATLGVGLPPPVFAELIHDRTDGNPFFVQQVIRVLAEQEGVSNPGDAWNDRRLEAIEVPESIRSAVGRRLSRLSPEAQEILHVGSVLGRSLSFDDLVTLSRRSEDVVDAGIVEAERAGLVGESDPDIYTFNHALTQRTLYEELSPRRRRKLHLAAGEAIERLPERKREGRTAELARHFLEGGDTERAIAYAMQAGMGAEAVAGYAEAAWYYRTAVDLAGDLDNALQKADALDKYGRVLSLLGRVHDAVTSLEHAAQIYGDQGLRDDEAGIIATICEVSFTEGRAGAVVERVRQARRSLEERGGSPSILGRLYLAEGFYLWSQQDVEGLQSLLRPFLDVVRRAGDEEVLLQALIAASTILRLSGDVDEGLQMLAEGAALAEAAGNLYWQMMAHMAQGETHLLLGQLTAAAPALRRMYDLAERLHNPIWLAYAKAQLSWALRLNGDWDGAEREGEAAMAWASQAGLSWGGFFASLRTGELYLRQGRSIEAEGVLQGAWKIAESGHDTQWQELALSALADAEILRGNPDGALAWLDTKPERTADATSRGWALLSRDRPEEAEAIVRGMLEVARARRQDVNLPEYHQLLGAALAAQGRIAEAREEFDAGLALARYMGMPFEEGTLLYHSGLAMLAAGDLEEGRQQFREALEIFQRLGAAPYVELTEQTMMASRRRSRQQ